MERDEEQWVKAGAVINLRGEEMMVWVKARNQSRKIIIKMSSHLHFSSLE